jgi:hypothetical protein
VIKDLCGRCNRERAIVSTCPCDTKLCDGCRDAHELACGFPGPKDPMPNPRRHAAPPAPVDREPEPTPAPPPADTCRIVIATVEGSPEFIRSTLASLNRFLTGTETRPARESGRETRG